MTDDRVRLNVRLPKDLHTRLRVRAVETDMTMEDLVVIILTSRLVTDGRDD